MPSVVHARSFVVVAAGLAALGCSASTHSTRPATLGTPTSAAQMEALLDEPGPLEVETVVGADWAVTRAGLIDLDDPKAKAAGLTDGDEAIQIYTHVVRHPTRGTFLIDTGVSRRLVEDPGATGVGWLVRQFMHPERIKVRTETATVVAREPRLAGVLLTHLHLDHISGLADIPTKVPLYGGPGDARERAFLFMFSRGTIDNMLAGHGPLEELPFAPEPSGGFAGILDLFGDGSLFALLVPGHTAGSVAYVARTAHGAVLFTGDTSHTRWGWDHDVAPGSFSSDKPRNAASLAALRGLAARHPTMQVRLGHQQ